MISGGTVKIFGIRKSLRYGLFNKILHADIFLYN